MRMVVVGATGTIGRAVVSLLSSSHEIIKAGRNEGDIRVDITDPNSIRTMYEQLGKVDAVISVAGSVHFGPLSEMTNDTFSIGLKDKLLGQVNLVLIGKDFVRDEGSFTLTSGILADEPIRFGSSASTVNAGINAFVMASAVEMPRGIRINSVSPTVLEESMNVYGPYFRGFIPVAAQKVAQAYLKSVEGIQTGVTFKVF